MTVTTSILWGLTLTIEKVEGQHEACKWELRDPTGHPLTQSMAGTESKARKDARVIAKKWIKKNKPDTLPVNPTHY